MQHGGRTFFMHYNNSSAPKTYTKLTNNYFNHRTAVLSANNFLVEREVSKGCPQGSCCGPGYWNLQYNSLLNLNFTEHTKILAFADDVILLTEGRNVLEVENYTNIELNKIETWATNNKIQFNEEK